MGDVYSLPEPHKTNKKGGGTLRPALIILDILVLIDTNGVK
jgi:hypothetical protein